jgi:hypothetical protein
VTGSTVYYRAGVAGGFSISASSADGESGVTSYAFPALGAGWAASGSGASRTYTHSGSPSDPSEPNNVTASNNTGLASGPTSFTVTPDADPPSGGSVTYADGSNTTGSVAITTDDGTDGLSGLDASSGVIERESATLAGGVCGAFSGSWTPVTAPDTTIVGSTCYRYRYRISDKVGNVATYSSSNVVKVGGTPPAAPTLTLAESPSDPDQHVVGTTLYYNPGAGSGTFTVDADASDPDSAIEKVVFPALPGMTGGGDDLISPYQSVYSWTAGSTASGAYTVTARNNAGLTSDSAFSAAADGTPPFGHSVAHAGASYYVTPSVALTLDNGSDSGAGVDTSSGVVERQAATLANGNCSGWSGNWAPVTLAGGADTSVLSGRCYVYRYTIADNVGNPSAASPETGAAKIDAAAPTTTDNAPTVWQASEVTVTLSATDAESGVATTEYRIDGGPYQDGTTVVIPAPADGSNDGTHAIAYRSRDVAGNVEAFRNATVSIDVTPPVPVLLDPGDTLSSVATLSSTTSADTTEVVFERSPAGADLWTPIGRDTSAPFSIDFDTNGLADGMYDLRARAADRAGNSANSTTRTVRLFNSAPTGGGDSTGGGSAGGDAGGGTGAGDQSGGDTGGGGSIGGTSGGSDSSSGLDSPSAKLTLKVFAPKKFSKRKRLVVVRALTSRAASGKVILKRCKMVAKRVRLAAGKTRVRRKLVCRAVFSKRVPLRAGTTRVTLRIPKRVPPGPHSLVVSALATRPTTSSATRSLKVHIVR